MDEAAEMILDPVEKIFSDGNEEAKLLAYQILTLDNHLASHFGNMGSWNTNPQGDLI